MAKILVIHHDRSMRSYLESQAKRLHEIEGGTDLVAGIRLMPKFKPDLIIVGHDSKKEEGLRLLKYMRQNVLKTPVIVVCSAGAGVVQPLAIKLGAKAFLEHPVDQARFEQAIDEALQSHAKAQAGPPPLTDEELRGNLSMLERDLNKRMKCVAGRNQVYIQSMILGGGVSRPRICLKCSLRAEFGLKRDVYYEFIRDVCCGEPARCEAVQLFRARESA